MSQQQHASDVIIFTSKPQLQPRRNILRSKIFIAFAGVMLLHLCSIGISSELDITKHNVSLYTSVPISEVVEKSADYDIEETQEEVESELQNIEAISECPLIPPGLKGRFKVNETDLTEEQLEETIGQFVDSGGFGKPTECVASERVAIIIPYRDRKDHLKVLLMNLHPLLKRQQIEYGIFVVEQGDKKFFNRAKLFNVGYKEAMKLYDFTCFIFHDVDLVPEDDRILYTCSEQPRHMSVAINVFKYRLPFPDLFGGVSALRRDQFEKVNGFSNTFWGWGGEDNDMFLRIKFRGMYVLRHSEDISHYKMLSHTKRKGNPQRFRQVKEGKNKYKSNGLSSLNYTLKVKELRPLYTWISVEL